MIRRIAGILGGLGYEIVVVFSLIAMNTESSWFVFFLLTSLLGIFYPAIGFLVVDLKSLIAKAAFVGIFAVHIFLVVSYFFKDVFAAPMRDFRILEHPVSSSIVIALASIPQLVCITYFIQYIVRNGFVDREDEQSLVNIHSQ